MNNQIKKLKEVTHIIMGQSPSSNSYNILGNGLPFFQGKTEFGEVSPTAVKWCTSPKKIALPGDILISVRAPVGPTNLANVECCIGRGLAAIRAIPEKIDRNFLWLQLRHLESFLVSKGQGSTFHAINADELKDLKLFVPDDIKLQVKIANQIEEQLAELHKSRKSLELLISEINILPKKILSEAFKEVENG